MKINDTSMVYSKSLRSFSLYYWVVEQLSGPLTISEWILFESFVFVYEIGFSFFSSTFSSSCYFPFDSTWLIKIWLKLLHYWEIAESVFHLLCFPQSFRGVSAWIGSYFLVKLWWILFSELLINRTVALLLKFMIQLGKCTDFSIHVVFHLGQI